jgi:pyridinium-3,5-bisthiocarboxylic acid mononucleotide nickel chelatase
MIAYFDCTAGISGDMCLGAIVDAGVPLREIEKGLRALPVGGYTLKERKVTRWTIAATKVDVVVELSKGTRHRSGAKRWGDIKRIVTSSSLDDDLKQKGLRVFRRLFEAEGNVHGAAYDKTHLHEIGAVDCIVDIFGTLIGLAFLCVERVYSSAVNIGGGFVETEHGRLPVPAPATVEILKGAPVYSSGIPFELTTPTGAAILAEIADGFLEIPMMRLKASGYGAGTRDIEGLPNALRILIGEHISLSGKGTLPEVIVIETNIDDMNPQVYEHVMERLMQAGAIDVYLTQVIMKKGRPGIGLTVLCHEDRISLLSEVLFRETTTIGIRFHKMSRMTLERKSRQKDTGLGTIQVKVSRLPDGTVKCTPEYEDCRKIAVKHGVPLIEVMMRAVQMKGDEEGEDHETP